MRTAFREILGVTGLLISAALFLGIIAALWLIVTVDDWRKVFYR